jgi:hypothetical protein
MPIFRPVGKQQGLRGLAAAGFNLPVLSGGLEFIESKSDVLAYFL